MAPRPCEISPRRLCHSLCGTVNRLSMTSSRRSLFRPLLLRIWFNSLKKAADIASHSACRTSPFHLQCVNGTPSPVNPATFPNPIPKPAQAPTQGNNSHKCMSGQRCRRVTPLSGREMIDECWEGRERIRAYSGTSGISAPGIRWTTSTKAMTARNQYPTFTRILDQLRRSNN